MSWQGAPADEREIRPHAAYCTPNRTSIVCSSAPEPLLARVVGVLRPQLPGDHFGFKRGRVTRHPHAWRSRKASRVVHLLDEPATGAAHSVEARRRRCSWCGRCTGVRPAGQHKTGSAPSSCVGRKHSGRAGSSGKADCRRALRWAAAGMGHESEMRGVTVPTMLGEARTSHV